MPVRIQCTEFCRPPNPQAEHLRGVARLDGDIGELLPYLNTVLGGHLYVREPPSLTIKYQAKLITLYPRRIAINILKDESEAASILAWLVGRINETFERRGEIEPRYEVAPKPRVLEILKHLPRTNCRRCGHPTCMVFAVHLSENRVGPAHCPELEPKGQRGIEEYLQEFHPPRG